MTTIIKFIERCGIEMREWHYLHHIITKECFLYMYLKKTRVILCLKLQRFDRGSEMEVLGFERNQLKIPDWFLRT